jgi:hypothetical protein
MTSSLPPRRRIWPVVLRVVAVALVAAGVYFFARNIDGRVLLDALRGAAPLPIALAAAMGFANLFFKALCWRVMLA